MKRVRLLLLALSVMTINYDHFISVTLNSAPVFAERTTKIGEMVKDAISNN